jgi:predicted glycogen debranching enzyme
MISFNKDNCGNFEKSSRLEWLETNGIGGFASGTVSGSNTRRYHGVLTAATRPPLGRVTMVSKLEETLILDGQKFEISANKYPGGIFPKGFEHLLEFRLDPFPMWVFQVGEKRLEKRLFMPHGMNSTVCRWSLSGSFNEAFLEVRPLISFVDYHHLQHTDTDFDGSFETDGGVVKMRPYPELPEIFFNHNGADVVATGHWYRDLEYTTEEERGFDFREDLFQPFLFRFDLSEPAIAIVSTEEIAFEQADKLEKKEIGRRDNLVKIGKIKEESAKRLILSADQFIVKRGSGQTIIAGYPWFSDWGRDTMISLPGLSLATGRPEVAKTILREYSNHISEGMLPNRFPDVGDGADYNTVDATLWYFEAIRAYLEATGDDVFVRDELYEKLAGIVASHMRGTRYNIHLDTDGLLYAGEDGVQLTWMDAKIGDLVITPRTGKPVEIQALWFNALKTMEDLAGRYGHDEDAARFRAMSDLAFQSFNAVFWNEERNCLYDVVENGSRDKRIRPNQIFAVSLHYPILDEERWGDVVEKVEKCLLTPLGLRSLTPEEEGYVGRYTGSPFERDSAYHQGTVWGWLIGPFIDAYVRVHLGDKGLKRQIKQLLSGFEQHLNEAGIGQISEIFDGDEPHHPRGCPAQAWSVAEVLRVTKRHL